MILGHHVLAIADAGLAFAGDTAGDPAMRLGILLDIENILDKGRGYAAPEERPVINQKTDELRDRIRTLLDSMPADEAREFMVQRGRQAQNQFPLGS